MANGSVDVDGSSVWEVCVHLLTIYVGLIDADLLALRCRYAAADARRDG